MLALTFQIGPESVGLDIRRVREVIPRVRLRTTIGAPHWYPGVFVYRGYVIPVVDLHQLTGHGECPLLLSSRIVLITVQTESHANLLLGLLAAQVADLREITIAEESSPHREHLHSASRVSMGALVPDSHGGIIRILDPEQLLPRDALAWITSTAGERS
ncbi:MAG: chemotaxis protein CheW [Bacteroidales bacterium]|nr:chemotaxis protein CheW [Bacteroidales bacterium]